MKFDLLMQYKKYNYNLKDKYNKKLKKLFCAKRSN